MDTPSAEPRPRGQTDRPVPSVVRRFLAGIAFSALGNGLVLPFLVIYLHEVRGFTLPIATLTLSILGGVGLGTVAVAGTLIDRLGTRRVLIASLLLQTAGFALLALVHHPWQAFAVAVVMGAGNGGYWPSMSALLSSLVPAASRARVFGVQFALLNAGIGVGGILGGLVVHVGRPGTFEAIYLLDALTFLPLVFFLLTLRASLPAPSLETRGGSYRAVLRDRPFVRFLAVNAALVAVGYAQVDAGVPPFARAVAHVSTRTIGFGFAANTAMIVLAQLLVLRRLEGRRRSRALSLVALIWAVSWLLLGASGTVPAGPLRGVLLCTCLAVFGLGETLLSPLAPAITNDLAPESLRGRYNALSSLTWQLSFVIGPLVAGQLLGRGLSGVWVGLLVAGCLAAAVLATTLEKVLTAAQNGVHVPTPPPISAMSTFSGHAEG